MLRTVYSLLIMILVVSCHVQKVVKEVKPVEPPEPVEPVEPVEVEIKVEPAAAVEAPEATPVDEKPVVPVASKNAAHAKDIKIAKRIVRWKVKRDHSVWWECGRKYHRDEFYDAALEWAHAINRAYENTSYKLRSGKVVKVNKAEAIGIMIRETRLDRCAVGPYPREFAYKHNIIKKRRGTLSHTMDEIKTIFTHWRFQGRLADIGPGQIVKRIGKGKEHIKWETVENFLSVDPGIQLLFDEMADRGQMYSTRTPSNKWPGNGPNMWYTNHVLRMGGKIIDKPQRQYLMN